MRHVFSPEARGPAVRVKDQSKGVQPRSNNNPAASPVQEVFGQVGAGLFGPVPVRRSRCPYRIVRHQGRPPVRSATLPVRSIGPARPTAPGIRPPILRRKGPFRGNTDGRFKMMQKGDEIHHPFIIIADLQPQGALTNGRQHYFRGQKTLGPVGQIHPMQAGRGHNDGLVLAVVEFPEPGIQITPKCFDLKVRPPEKNLGPAAQARCSHHRPARAGLPGRRRNRPPVRPESPPFRG